MGEFWSSTEIKTVDDENEIEPYNLLISYWIRQCNLNDNIVDQEKIIIQIVTDYVECIGLFGHSQKQ